MALVLAVLLLPAVGYGQITFNYNGFEPNQGLKQAAIDLDTLTQSKGIAVTLVLSGVDTITKGKTVVKNGVKMVHYPEHNYTWSGTYPYFKLQAPSQEGLIFGIYGLLDEVLGFRFIHPKQTIKPKKVEWPKAINYSSTPRFSKHGFHLHTQHPLELTEQLHNPDFPNAWQDVQEYINWLVRNRQNYWEWCLLRTVDMEKWQPHAKQMVDYSHQRGIMIGIDVSLHMIQQRTFQLYKSWPKSWRSKENQMLRSLDQLYYANWDFLNVEFNTAEFIGGKDKLKSRLKRTLIATARNKYNSNIMGRKHVVSPENMVGEQADVFSANDSIDLYRGVGIHTVMMYGLEDSVAPVYENQNFHHIYKDMQHENHVREVWFYPESAYWVTYDNSVPMLLLPYLLGRLNDILLCEKENVPNHLTFSSGWEWGYWAVDWSIARWSWNSTVNDVEKVPEPMEWVSVLGYSNDVKTNLYSQLKLQQDYLLNKNLLRYMCAQTVTDEFSLFRKQFQPRPEFTFKHLARKSNEALREQVRTTGLKQLDAFYQASAELNQELAEMIDTLSPSPMREYWLALNVTSLRAKHRYQSVSSILAHREKAKDEKLELLNKAKKTRLEALGYVHLQELDYKYSGNLLYGEYDSFTSYPHGYLFMPHHLHFWKREESQSLKNRWNYQFMNIWKVGRIIGL